MKHNNIIIMFVLALVISLTGCGNTNKLSEYDMTGISFIEYRLYNKSWGKEKSLQNKL